MTGSTHYHPSLSAGRRCIPPFTSKRPSAPRVDARGQLHRLLTAQLSVRPGVHPGTHPRASTVQALTQALGGPGSKSIHAFDAKASCKQGTDANWLDVPANDHLWVTERDGDIVLTTTGDGVFVRE